MKYLKIPAFLAGLILIIYLISRTFGNTDYRIYQDFKGFYEEPENSLDAVYIGASNVYYYFQAPFAWHEYGIAAYPISMAMMPTQSMKYVIEEARKTQPDALYIVNLNNFKNTDFTEAHFHYLTDYMRFSPTKVNLVNRLADDLGITGFDKLEYYLPFIRFHSNWSSLTEDAFEKESNGMKGANCYNSFLKDVTDISGSYRETEQDILITEDQDSILRELLDYCKEEEVNVLFVIVPQAIPNESRIAQLNTMSSIVEEEGFDILNLMDEMDTIGLNMKYDYANTIHTNIHGSLKYSHFLGQYLIDKYGFEDHRDDPKYAAWDTSYEKYLEKVSPYAIDLELEHAERDEELSAPKLSSLSARGQRFRLTWEAVSGADGYRIYRKYVDADNKDQTPWVFAGDVNADTTSFEDEGLLLRTKYYYTVVPYRLKEGADSIVSDESEEIEADADARNDSDDSESAIEYALSDCSFGYFDIDGISGTTIMNAPELKSLEEREDGVTITWSAVEGADGYGIYRKINGQTWIRIEDIELKDLVEAEVVDSEAVTEETATEAEENKSDSDSSEERTPVVCYQFTDQFYQEGIPYIYSVGAFRKEEEENIYGYYDKTGLLKMADLEAPILSGQVLEDGKRRISWEAVKGVSSYTLYGMDENGEWITLKSGINAKTTAVTDSRSTELTEYRYKLSSVLSHDGEKYEFESEPLTIMP